LKEETARRKEVRDEDYAEYDMANFSDTFLALTLGVHIKLKPFSHINVPFSHNYLM